MWLSTYRSFNIQLTSSDYSKLVLFVYILKLPSKYGRTPLHHAAWGGHLHIVKYLIDEQGVTHRV